MTQLKPAVHSNDHSYGNPEALIVLVEYGDYECPYCGKAYPIVKNIQQRMGNDLKFVFRNFPLANIHANAFSAAVATEAAGLQNKFWEMHDIIFENQNALDSENLFRFADHLRLDIERFSYDIQLKSLSLKVEQDFESGLRSGVNRTPTFFINGVKYDGSWSGDQLYQYLKSQLSAVSI